MSKSNWGLWRWRNPLGKKRDSISNYKISNEIAVGIEISFKEKDIKYLEYFFYPIQMIRSARTMIGNSLIAFLQVRSET